MCGKSHHTLLHDHSSQLSTTNDANSQSTYAGRPSNVISQCNNVSTQENVSALLQVVPIRVIGKDDTSVTTYALIDSGSDTTMIDKSLTSRLGIEGEQQSFFINTVAESNAEVKASKVNFKISSVNTKEEAIVDVSTAWSMDLNIPLKHSRKNIQELPHLQTIPFPDVDRQKISVLLGTNVIEAFVPIDVRKGLPNQPLAIKTILGWSVLGKVSDAESNFNINCTCTEDSILDERLKGFWEIESHGTEKSSTKPRSIEDINAMKIIEGTLSKVEGHYQMGLLWRNPNVQ